MGRDGKAVNANEMVTGTEQRHPRRGVWLASALLVAAIAGIGSVLGAVSIAHNNAQQSQQSAAASSMEIASTLRLAIQHEQDLAVSSGAFVSANPEASQVQFDQWTDAVSAFKRYPELVGIAEIARVPASDATTFATWAEKDLTDPQSFPTSASAASRSPFVITPSGSRPYYCLRTVWESQTDALETPAGLDFCQTVEGPWLAKIEASGQNAYLPYGSGKNARVAVGTPIYRGGVVPATVQLRQQLLLGWTGVEITPGVLLRTALQGHPRTSVAFIHGSGRAEATFRAGTAPVGAHATTIDLHNGWRVRTYESVSSASLTADHSTLFLLVGGLLLAFLLGVLVFVLGTSRSRALQLVHERTVQLQHQAMHDSLTGLPNRALILDRIDQMLAHARRDRTPVAVLFLDLDNFKDINDSLGHSAGDQVLIGVGERVVSALREGDTVGRLGGDEFVILVEGRSLDAGAMVVADRVLDALSVPFEITDSEVPLMVRASIGIAEGERSTPDELLRDADIALYRAKEAGKRRSVVFTPAMQEVLDEHRTLEMDLAGALGSGQFRLEYGPTRDLTTGDTAGVEVLVYWDHPSRGTLSAEEFGPALDASGQSGLVGRWVVDTACRQGAQWQDEGAPTPLWIDTSTLQFERPEFTDDVRDALSTSGLNPGLLTVAVAADTVLMRPEASRARLNALAQLGIRIAFDDRPSGLLSLASVRDLPFDSLIVDAVRLSQRHPDQPGQGYGQLVELGRVLGLQTVAVDEGLDQQLHRSGADASTSPNGSPPADRLTSSGR